MKLLSQCLWAIPIICMLCSCGDETEEEQVINILDEVDFYAFSEAEGAYGGTVMEGSNNIATWVALLHMNQIYGISTGEADELILTGTENFPNISGTAVSPNDPTYVVSFTGTLVSDDDGTYSMNGDWSDDETSGTFSGERIIEGPDGGYTGLASENNEHAGRWVAVLYQNQLIGVSTNYEDEILLEGTLSGNTISGTGTGSDNGAVFTISFSGTLEQNTNGEYIMSGDWSDDQSNGQFRGKRIYFE